MKLIVTIPAQNEAPTIGRVVEGIPRQIPGVDAVEVIVVDDGSTDGTPHLARAAGAQVVTVTGRPGLGPIWRLGMERAIQGGADLIVNLDGDGQFDSADVAEIVQPLVSGECDFITCTRFAGGGMRGRNSQIEARDLPVANGGLFGTAPVDNRRFCSRPRPTRVKGRMALTL